MPKRVVTPVEDDLTDLIESAVEKHRELPPHDEGDMVPHRPEPPELEPTSLEGLALTLAPAADRIRATIAEIALIPINRATPEQRTALVELRDVLDRTRADLSTWVDAIDISFRRAATEAGATEIVLSDGIAKVEAPRGEWVVNVPGLKAELAELTAHGVLSAEEFDSIFEITVTEKANNAKLNYFASKRGEELAEAVARYRVWKDGNPANARVKFLRKPQ